MQPYKSPLIGETLEVHSDRCTLRSPSLGKCACSFYRCTYFKALSALGRWKRARAFRAPTLLFTLCCPKRPGFLKLPGVPSTSARAQCDSLSSRWPFPYLHPLIFLQTVLISAFRRSVAKELATHTLRGLEADRLQPWAAFQQAPW